MRRSLGVAVAVSVLAFGVASCGAAEERVVVAAGTTLVDSGILDDLVSAYERARPEARISVVGDATARVLALGRSETASVLITHSPESEERFLEEAGAARYELLMMSHFLLLGPAEAVTSLAGMSAAEAFAAIAGQRFVARADGSGTSEAEAAIWSAAGIDPSAETWYSTTGLGMAETLQVAETRGAFVLAEAGAYLEASGVLSLVPAALAPGPLLDNPYHLILTVGAPQEATALVEWLLSPEGRDALHRAQRERFGEVVYQAP